MKKRIIAMLLAAVMILAMAACGAQKPAETTAPAAPETTAAPATEAAPVALGKIAVLNTALEQLKLTEDAEARFNAYWMKGYPVADYVANNFWYQPADDTKVSQVSYQDGYAYEITYAEYASQIISIDVHPEIAENYEMVACGQGSAMDMFPYHVGYVIIGAEAILFMNDDGYEAPYLFEDVGMVEAEEYDFVCADGYSETIHKDDLAEVSIFYSESGTIDCSSVAYPEYSLNNLAYIIPTDSKKDAEAPAEGVAKINVFANSVGVIGTEPTAEGYFGGSVYEAYSVAELLAECEMPEGTKVTSIAYTDGTTMEEDYALFAQKYISLDSSKERQPFTLGKAQPKGEYVKNAGYYIIDENNGFVYVPETYVEGAGMALTDILAALGMQDAVSVDLVCADGYTETVVAADFAKVQLFHIGGRVDASSVANPSYTLYNTMYIIPMG